MRWERVCLALLGMVACDEEPPAPRKEPVSVSKPAESAAGAAPSVDCEDYCSKLKNCFPGAIDPEVTELWPGQCAADCRRDLKQGGRYADITKAVAACTKTPCGEPLGRCMDEQLAEMKVSQKEHRYLGLHPMCTLSHLCFVTQQYGYVLPEVRDVTRERLAPTRADMYENLREAGVNLDVACRAQVEGTNCAGASPLERQGPAIDVDCDRYCDKLRSCAPKPITVKDWTGNCRTSCREEAAAGTTFAAFYAAASACSNEACGDPFGRCIAEKVDAHWPDGVKGDWDMRGLHANCQLVRICHEMSHNETDPLVARMSRRGHFGYYAEHFAALAESQCTAMRTSMIDSGTCF